jgi:glycosyltransferase involved in cell wall biosynthesis
MSIRLAALIATEEVSGPGRQLAAMAHQLARHDVLVDVLLTSRRLGRPPFAEYLQRAGVRHAIVSDRGPVDWGTVRTTRYFLASRGLTLLQTHGYKATAIGYTLRRLDPALKWIGFYHGATRKGFKDAAYQQLERCLLRAADRIVVVSAHQEALFAGRDKDVHIIDNAVVPDFTAADAAPALERGGGPAIGVIGRLSREKGVDVFLRACRLLADGGHPFTAWLIGDGPERTYLERLAQQLNLQARIRFIGHVATSAALYAELDLVVLPSRSEGLPNVLLEALAADRQVVATAVGAVPRVLSIPGSGYLVPPEDPPALASAMTAALTEGQSASSMVARRQVVERYSLEKRVERHIALYSGLLQADIAGESFASPLDLHATPRT